jgi:hypothetical protein
MEREAALSWAWLWRSWRCCRSCAVTDRNPKDRLAKHAMRLVLLAVVTFVYDVNFEGDAWLSADLLSVVVTVLAHRA